MKYGRSGWKAFLLLGPVSGLLWALLFSLLFSMAVGMEFAEVFPLAIMGGIFMGMVLGIVGGLSMREDEFSVPFQDKAAFLSRLDVALGKRGYHLVSRTEYLLEYHKGLGFTLESGFFPAEISVKIEDGSALISGPHNHVKRLILTGLA